jgi:hypothetical protein
MATATSADSGCFRGSNGFDSTKVGCASRVSFWVEKGSEHEVRGRSITLGQHLSHFRCCAGFRTWLAVRLESVMRFKADIGETSTGLYGLPLTSFPKVRVSRPVPMGLLVLACFDHQWPN